jgi:hypothetical protein
MLVLLAVVAGTGTAAYLFGLLRKKAPVAPPGAAGAQAPGATALAPEADGGFFAPTPAATQDGADERALEVLELEAKVAYHEIPPAATPEERVRALRDLAQRFAPTTTGRSAAKEAERLEAEQRQGLLETERLERGLSLGIEHLRKELAWPPPEGKLPRPLALLRQAAVLAPPAAPEARERFDEARALVAGEIRSVSERLAREALARAEEAAKRGDFAPLRATLAEIRAGYGDDEPLPATLPDAPALRALAAEAATRLAGLAEEERTNAGERRRAERVLLAAAIGPGGTALDDLARLDFAKVERELGALEQRLTAGEPRDRARALAGDLARARGALELLEQAFQAGAWRRFSVGVPTGGRVAPRDAIGASTRGLVFAGASGVPEEIAWSVLIPSSAAVEPLFRSRLTRDYTPEECERILALLHVVAAVQGARIVGPLLSPDAKGLLSPEEARALAGAFEPFQAWIDEARAQGAAAATPALEHEREAAELLVEALGASQREAWTLATSYAERLLSRYADTWLVQLLSSGPVQSSPVDATGPVGEGDAPRPDGAPKGG